MKQAKHRIKAMVILTLLLSLATAAGWYFLRPSTASAEIISLSGRIESDDATVAAKTSGRIREITVREGDAVKEGQVIALLDDEQIKAREEQAQSAVMQAEAKVMHAQQQIAVLQTQLQESRLGVSQSRADAEGRVSQAQAHVAAAEASLAKAQADYNQARYDHEKYTTLAEQGDVSEREGRQAQTALETHRAVVIAAEKQVEAARGALAATKASLDNPVIRAAQAAGVEQQIQQAKSAVASAQAEAARARAQLDEAKANRDELNILAPFDGIVATRTAEPGEVVAAGAPLITLLNPRQVYLRGYIPEGDIGRVRTGQVARVYLDSNPKQPLDATVSRIDPQASFTPENTYFRDDRVKQVVGVKLQLTKPEGFAKPGMPADGEVLVDGKEWVATARKE
ncbi:MAG: HlyD family efflux transporter periplasmic adaptor subunit [Acidobacteria bacterium]|nr:HlyD family efflux transporter periplasmic adaptor subunit [Acidobacteriota bacterium]